MDTTSWPPHTTLATLTKREATFLRRQGIAARWVLDATPIRDWTMSVCQARMIETSTYLVVGHRPRCPAGHRLTNRRGRCVQCDPAILKKTREAVRHGHVYLAESAGTGLVKIGSCNDLTKRERELNHHDTYAGARDWRIRDSHFTIACGMFETALHRRLDRHRVDGRSDRYGTPQRTRELFGCSYRTARRHMLDEIVTTASLYAEIESLCADYC